MIVTLWGVRGSLACSGPENVKYGGNTSCVEVRGSDDTVLILDAGTGIRRMGVALEKRISRINILLSHLHLDHIQGLGFFSPLYDANMEIHIYGPAKSDNDLYLALTKYLSPPLFPVLLRDLPCHLYLHSFPEAGITLGEFTIHAQAVSHPGWTLGYRIDSPDGSIAYLPDHELTLGNAEFISDPSWASGYDIAANVDILIHDAQYSLDEYEERIGWGHSTIEQLVDFAHLAHVKNVVTFHHDPSHNDHALDAILSTAVKFMKPDFDIYPGQEGTTFKLENKQITISRNISIDLLFKLNGICAHLSLCIDDIYDYLEIFLSDEHQREYSENIPIVNRIFEDCILLKQKLPSMLLSEKITIDINNLVSLNAYLLKVREELNQVVTIIEDNINLSLDYFQKKNAQDMIKVLLSINAILNQFRQLLDEIELSQLIHDK
jgi:phosphoribosyl 1,2-cyclic phosphodiesterase